MNFGAQSKKEVLYTKLLRRIYLIWKELSAFGAFCCFQVLDFTSWFTTLVLTRTDNSDCWKKLFRHWIWVSLNYTQFKEFIEMFKDNLRILLLLKYNLIIWWTKHLLIPEFGCFSVSWYHVLGQFVQAFQRSLWFLLGT